MKYWVALLGDRQERLWFVTEKEEHEFGLTKVLRKIGSGYCSEYIERWVDSGQVLNVDKIWTNPIDNSTKENYRCNLLGIDPFKDRTDIERFAMNGFRATIRWVEVSKEIFDWFDGSGWCDAVMDLLSDPKLDFKSEIVHNQTWLTSDEKMMVRVSRHERIKYPTRVANALVEILKEKKVPNEIIQFLVEGS